MNARLEWGEFLGFWLVFFRLGGFIFGFGYYKECKALVKSVKFI